MRRLLGLLLLPAAVALAGCQEEAQRPVHLDKGVYRGAPDTARSAEQVRALEQRTATQRF
ncbi:hypothetical protein [Azospirillum thermophilum]|uniref:Uncharacterized protein n=1 Tax=Azospirillum thermophilum TaxID=2202148 RepID=A0A2S2CQJ9_9PROT|nr:hypothetical protein [Azospirillum thermophilum]AWK86756.1 hypothetical protein DEW08_11355 [Azospirillum thermophilum]